MIGRILENLKKARAAKDEVERESNRKRIIEGIVSLMPDIDIFEDDDNTIPTTREHLEKKSYDELIDLFEDALKFIDNNKW